MRTAMVYEVAILCALVSTILADGYAGHHHQPYSFGYVIKDPHGQQHRHETGVGGRSVRGSYGFTDERGVQRRVEYIADHNGFRAVVKTNEPGTASQDPAAARVVSTAHPYHGNPEVVHHHGFAAGYPGYGFGRTWARPAAGYGPAAVLGYGAGYDPFAEGGFGFGF